MTDIPADALVETWESIHKMSLDLAAKIEKHIHSTGEKFDAMIVVPRGSYYPANIVSRRLGFSANGLLHACLESYEQQGTKRLTDFKLGQMPTKAELAGKKLLIIEEVCDTGRTLSFLVKRFKSQGAVLIRSGALHYKPGLSQTGFVPDWFVIETDKWIVYPWELL